MKGTNVILLSVLSALFLAVVAAGCGSSSNNNPGPKPVPDNGDCQDVSGKWSVTQEIDAVDCGEGLYTETESNTIEQNGCSLTITDEYGNSSSAKISGSRITGSASWYEEGGKVTQNFTVTVSGNSFSGSSTWKWSDGTYSCDGTSEITAARS